MRTSILFVTVSFVLLLTPYAIVYCERQIEYDIHVDSDGLATWIITQVAELNASIDSLEQFQNRVTLLVEAAKNETGREMTGDVESIKHVLSGSYVIVEYIFMWKNFSKIEDSKILIGDVFQVENIFLQLCGDGEVHLTYPSGYIVEAVSPEPYERDDSQQTIRWLGTNDFTNGLPIIILEEKIINPGFLEALQESAIMIVSLVAIISASSVSFFVFRRHRKTKRKTIESVEHLTLPRIESDEDKIVKLLKASGGGLHQSAIVNQLKFSKAKTSQLLAALESKGVVSRYKKGRNKIVTLVERDKGGKK
jgi:uncharacterized membrane protein